MTNSKLIEREPERRGEKKVVSYQEDPKKKSQLYLGSQISRARHLIETRRNWKWGTSQFFKGCFNYMQVQFKDIYMLLGISSLHLINIYLNFIDILKTDIS